MEKKTKLTIKQIAELASTSKTTVSFYLNGKFEKMSAETKERIEKVIEETNYQPSAAARSLNAKKMNLIGVIIGDITNTFANQIVKGIDDAAREKNFQIIVGNSNYDFENEEMYVERMLGMGVDGFIVQPTSQFHHLLPKIKSMNKEVVFIDSQVKDNKDKWVKTNNYEAVMEATEKMIALGYDDFVLLTADPEVLSTRKERARGFTDTVELAKKNVHVQVVPSNVTSEDITEILGNIIKINHKTLIFAANCWLLPIVYFGLKDLRNLMPNTIGLLGFDNLEWTNFSSPTVTTIVQPSYEEGKQAAIILIDSVENENLEAPNQILKCDINWGESTLKLN